MPIHPSGGAWTTKNRVRLHRAPSLPLRPGWLLPHRNDHRAFTSQKTAIPVAPTRVQRQSGDAPHEIEFGGPHVPTRRRPPFQAIILGPVVVRCEALIEEVKIVEAESIILDGERAHRLARRKPSQLIVLREEMSRRRVTRHRGVHPSGGVAFPSRAAEPLVFDLCCAAYWERSPWRCTSEFGHRRKARGVFLARRLAALART